MQIVKLEIQNFRNIKSATYNLFEITAIVGKNHLGKTNTLHALYWLLSDSLLDNSKQFDTITPKDDNRALTSVKVTLDDGFTIAKTYRELWQKQRGTSIEKLTGHETNYFINGSPIKTQGEALRLIKEKLLGTETPNVKSVDLIKTLTNPLYLFLQEDWKKAREFIVSLVKIKTDDEIIAENPKFEPIKADLIANLNRTDLLIKNYTSKIEMSKKEIQNSETLLDEYQKQVDENYVSDEEVARANIEKENYNTNLIEIKKGKTDSQIAQLKEQRSQWIAKRNEIEIELQRKKSKEEFEFYQQRQDLIAKRNETSNLAYEYQKKLTQIKMDRQEIDILSQKIEKLQKQRQGLLAEYREWQGKEFTFSKIECPHCHHQLNVDEEEKARENFNAEVESALAQIKNKGKDVATEISSLQATLVSKQDNLSKSTSEDDLLNSLNKTNEELKAIDSQIDAIPHSSNNFKKEDDADWANVTSEIARINANIWNIESNSKADIEKLTNDFIASNMDIFNHFSEVSKKQILLQSAKAKLAEEEIKHQRYINELTNSEKLKLIAKDFILAKLAMINESTKEVFPDIEFILVEQNITEGSFTEVCYPLIKGKKTPFANGSNSERILTGIALINDIQKFLKLEPLPIIFDEGETLDSTSLDEISTDSQIIYSQVTDDYSQYDFPVAIQK